MTAEQNADSMLSMQGQCLPFVISPMSAASYGFRVTAIVLVPESCSGHVSKLVLGVQVLQSRFL